MDLPLDFNDVFNIGLAVRYINVILERQLHIAVTIFQTYAETITILIVCIRSVK